MSSGRPIGIVHSTFAIPFRGLQFLGPGVMRPPANLQFTRDEELAIEELKFGATDRLRETAE